MDLLTLPLDLLPVILPIVRMVAEFIWWLLPTTVQEVLLWQFVYLPLILAVRFVVAIQYERGGWWRLLTPLAIRTGILDIYLNYTTFAAYLWDWPREREYTLSKRLERLVLDPGLRGVVARLIARFTNVFDPNHIPLP